MYHVVCKKKQRENKKKEHLCEVPTLKKKLALTIRSNIVHASKIIELLSTLNQIFDPIGDQFLLSQQI